MLNSKALSRAQRNKKTATRRRIIAAIVACAISLGGGIAVPTTANADVGTTACGSSLVFIAVRGTYAPAGTGTDGGGRLYLSGGFGDQIEPLRANFVNKVQGMKVWARAVNYPATLVHTEGTAYGTSVDAGARNLVEFLNTLPSCPVQPMVVLAGHSQGADVIAQALAGVSYLPGLTTSARGLIRAVVMYGDPRWNGNWSTHAPNSPGGRGFLPPRAASQEQALVNNYQTYGWPHMSTNPNPQYFSKIRSMCYTNDWACQNGNPFNASQDSVHNSYKFAATSIFDWALYMVSNQI